MILQVCTLQSIEEIGQFPIVEDPRSFLALSQFTSLFHLIQNTAESEISFQPFDFSFATLLLFLFHAEDTSWHCTKIIRPGSKRKFASLFQ
mmetsp:Transcript_16577/g.24783  ORF Transcript_16577/g.24783 Transcript_16577/m.24783 type:complete len:91 (-) Transcript_16577:243-515(-)